MALLDPSLVLLMRRHLRGSYESRLYRLNTYCDNSDGANFCSCQRNLDDPKWCAFYGRHLEPLAFSIANDRVYSQDQSPLLTSLPLEIREMIWGYALTDTTSIPARGTIQWHSMKYKMRSKRLPKSDIAFGLVESCKAVYLETWKLPLLLNYHNVYDFLGPIRPQTETLAPWQAALITRFDISISQMALQRGELWTWLEKWHPKERHEGAYIEPRFYEVMNLGSGAYTRPFPFEPLTKSPLPSGKANLRDGDELILPIAPKFRGDYSDIFYESGVFGTDYKARAMVARPLTHLTIRLSREDWLNWMFDPSVTMPFPNQLYLDPALGQVSASVLVMEDFATMRRAGEDVQDDGTWGALVGRLPDLKELKLVLETFDVKEDQLLVVVECAKTWRFPIQDAPFELVWDGKIQDASWSMEPGELNGDCNDSSDSQEEENDDDGDDDDDDAEDEGFSDREEVSDDSDVESNDPRSPSPPPPPRWNELRTQFQVRVVRYIRKKKEQTSPS